jgi:predicted nucleotidyltransferase
LEDRLARLVLFGSSARGDYDRSSDIDVAIIVRDRIPREVASLEFEHCLPLSALVLTEEELEHLRRRERRLALDLDREGIPI